jgi:hypothetical protein
LGAPELGAELVDLFAQASRAGGFVPAFGPFALHGRPEAIQRGGGGAVAAVCLPGHGGDGAVQLGKARVDILLHGAQLAL